MPRLTNEQIELARVSGLDNILPTRDWIDTIAAMQAQLKELEGIDKVCDHSNETIGLLQADVERLQAELAAAKQLAEKWMPDEEEDLMEYDGDNHGDTAEAAYNRCLKSCAEQLLAAIDAAKGGSQP